MKGFFFFFATYLKGKLGATLEIVSACQWNTANAEICCLSVLPTYCSQTHLWSNGVCGSWLILYATESTNLRFGDQLATATSQHYLPTAAKQHNIRHSQKTYKMSGSKHRTIKETQLSPKQSFKEVVWIKHTHLQYTFWNCLTENLNRSVRSPYKSACVQFTTCPKLQTKTQVETVA